MTTRSGLKALATVCLGASLASVSIPVLALTDVLETPSMKTERATKQLLLDVVRVGERLVAVGERGHIIFSDDQGQHWTQASVPVATTLTAVFFPTPTKGWAVGHSGVVLHSSDGGATWSKQLDGNQANKLVLETLQKQQTELETAVDASPDDRALSDRLEEVGMLLGDAEYDAEVGASKPLLDVWFRNESEGFVIGAYGLIFKTQDGGKTWLNHAARVPNPDRYHLNSITQVTGGALFMVGEAGLILRSTDQGETWEAVESPYQGSLFGVSGTGNVNEVLVFGLRGNVFRSVNLGRAWTVAPSDGQSTLNSAWVGSDGRITLVGNDGAVLVSTNAGESFRVNTRTDREGLASVTALPGDNLLIVGEHGVTRADPNGKNL